METIRITTSQNIDIDYEVAGLGERIVARILDLAFFFALYIIGVIAGAALSMSNGRYFIAILILYLALFTFYDLVCELLMNGQSLGKKIMKIRVISLDGAQPRFSQYLLRWLLRLVDFTITMQAGGLIAVAVSEKKQRIGDMVAGTILIKTTPRTNIEHLIFTPEPEDYIPSYQEAAQLTGKEIELIADVIRGYEQTAEPELIYSMARQVKQHLSIEALPGMHDLNFLKTIIKDYNHLTSRSV